MRRSLLTIISLLALSSAAIAQGMISGTVFDEGGSTPLQGAHVAAFPVDSQHPAADAMTDADGNYTLEVPFGHYNVLGVAENYYPEWYDNHQHRSEADEVVVTEGQNPEGIDFTLAEFQQEGGLIAGRVIEEGTDHGVSMAHVSAHRIEGDPFERSTMSGWDGSYELHNLPPGPYEVTADKFGWTQGTYPETLQVDGNTFENIDIYISRQDGQLGSISGAITDAASGDPVSGAVVVAQGDNPFNTRFGFSGDDGSYMIGDLHTDTYHVAAHKMGYYPGEYPDPVPVDGNDVEGIDIALSGIVPTGIMGMVTDADSGDPIGDAVITAIDVNHHWMHRSTSSGDDGTYTLQLPPGEYMVQARAYGYLPEDYPDNVVVPDDGFAENIDFALTSFNFGSIAGTVTNTDGEPVPGAVIRARLYDGFFERHTRTDENGDYLLADVVPGSYSVRAFKWGYEPGEYPDTVDVGDGEDVTGIDIILEPYGHDYNGHIGGTVTDEESGDPIEGALVVAFGAFDWRHGWFMRRAFTDADGAYLFDSLPDREFVLFAVHPDYIGEFYDNVQHYRDATPVTPDADGIDFALTHRTLGIRSIAGNISIPGQDNPGESVIYVTLDGQIVDIAASDIDGFYAINDLEIGTYDISVFSLYGEGDLGYPADVTFNDLRGADILLAPTSADEPKDVLPTAAFLGQNYPNPFNAQTMISFYLPSDGDVELSVYNVLGRKVATLVNGHESQGEHEVIWDGMESGGRPAATGVYFYKLTAGSSSETRRMTLLK